MQGFITITIDYYLLVPISNCIMVSLLKFNNMIPINQILIFETLSWIKIKINVIIILELCSVPMCKK